MRIETVISCRESETLREKYYHIRHKSGLDIYVIPKKMSTAYALFAKPHFRGWCIWALPPGMGRRSSSDKTKGS